MNNILISVLLIIVGLVLGLVVSFIINLIRGNLASKKNYYYKVRAYKTINGKKIYSSYSAIKTIKTK